MFITNGYKFSIIGLLLLIVANTVHAYTNNEYKENISASIELSKTNFYAGEIIIATLYVNCINSELAFIDDIPPLKLAKGEVATILPINHPVTSHVENNNGQQLTKYVIGQYAISIDQSGKNYIDISDIITGINLPVIQNHPFWGRIESYRTEKRTLKFKPVSINVMKLPDNKDELPYSGVIGNFHIETIVPNGEYVVNEGNTIYIVLEGEGLLPEEILPEYTHAFGDKIKLKSISGSTNTIYKDNKLISKRTWQCEIMPCETGLQEVGIVSFGYFNTESGNYQVTKSRPVTINIQSSTIRREVIDI